MPDPGTHVLISFWFKRFLFKKNTLLSMPLFLIGGILPDIVSRGGIILFPQHYYWFFQTFHTPLSLILQCTFLSFLFEKDIRLSTFVSLIAGITLHLLADSMQSHIAEGAYFWFYPFSNWTTEFGIFHVDFWPYLLAGSILLILLSFTIEKIITRIRGYINCSI